MNLFYDDFLFLSIDWQSIDPEKLMKKISVVFQEVYLFQDTIANNIRYGKKCHSWRNWTGNKIGKLLQFYYGAARGDSTLSGGEKQHISIGRAMLKNAAVVLLDERLLYTIKMIIIN